MKFYIVMTLETTEEGYTRIIYSKHLYFDRETAFQKAMDNGSQSCVLELTQTNSWNLSQIKSDRDTVVITPRTWGVPSSSSQKQG